MHRTTHRFWKCFDDLPEVIQRTAKKKFELLKEGLYTPLASLQKSREVLVCASGNQFQGACRRRWLGLYLGLDWHP